MGIFPSYNTFLPLTHEHHSSHDDSEMAYSFNSANKPRYWSFRYLQLKPEGASLSGEYEDFNHSRSAAKLCVLHMTAYFGLSILLFSFLVERWPIVDSVYFATVVFTTIGDGGDLVPHTDIARLVTVCLALYGFTILGVFLGIGGEAFLRSNAKRVEAMEKAARSNFIKIVKRNGNSDIDTDATDSMDGEVNNHLQPKQVPVPSILQEVKSVLLRELPIVVILIIIACVMMKAEGWSLSSSIYWTIISATSIGFGDFRPDTRLAKLGCIIFLPLVVAVMGEFLTHIAYVYLNRQNRKSEMEFLSRCLTLQDLKNMDMNRDGRVSEHEFFVSMLMTLHKVDESDIKEIEGLFHKLDADGNGYLEPRDLWLKQSWMETSYRMKRPIGHRRTMTSP